MGNSAHLLEALAAFRGSDGSCKQDDVKSGGKGQAAE